MVSKIMADFNMSVADKSRILFATAVGQFQLSST